MNKYNTYERVSWRVIFARDPVDLRVNTVLTPFYDLLQYIILASADVKMLYHFHDRTRTSDIWSVSC